ncbi:MAG TPA: hypothetical protein VF416_04800 [Marmoricola sp.]
MHQLKEHPLRTLSGLLVVAFCFFMLSASGQDGSYWENGPSWLGNTGWLAFLVTMLLFLAGVVYSVVRRVRSDRATI